MPRTSRAGCSLNRIVRPALPNGLPRRRINLRIIRYRQRLNVHFAICGGLLIAAARMGLVVAERNELSSAPGRVTSSPLGCPSSRPTLSLISRSTSSGGAPSATCEEAIDSEDDNCADHATNEASRISGPIPPDSLPEVSCNERAYNSQDCR